MKISEILALLAIGFAIWLIGSVYYAYRGPQILETTSLRYWVSFFISPVLSAVLCLAILKARGVPAADWASAGLLIAIPGMIGEAVVLTHLSTFMPRIHIASGGKYGAFLFAAYALVLGIAEFVTLRAAS